MDILKIAEELKLPDWLIGAGFVRSKVWDHLHGYKTRNLPSDIDLVYFDKDKKYDDVEINKRLSAQRPDLEWEVVNQATVHNIGEENLNISTADAISKWPETVTAVGVKLENGKLKLIAPLGIKDLVTMTVRPTPFFMATEIRRNKAKERFEKKRWFEKWPKLIVVSF